jgi:hypothetical protein
MRRSRHGEVVNCNQIPDVTANPMSSDLLKDFVLEPQRNSQWCYASAIEAVAKYYRFYEKNRLGFQLSQENIAKWYKNKNGMCGIDNIKENCPQDPIEILSKVSTVKTMNDSLTYIPFIKNHPLIGLVEGHYIVIVGHIGDDIYYYDPIHGTTYSSIEDTGLRKMPLTCFLNTGIPIEYINQDNETEQKSSKLTGVYLVTPFAGGKRRTRRRRGSKRRAKTVRRR